MPFALIVFLALFTAQTTTPSAPPPAVQPTTPAPAQTAPAKPPCRNPDASGKYRIGCGVTAPQLIHKVDPDFPRLPASIKLNLNLMVSLTIDTQGNPVDVHIANSEIDKVDRFSRAAQQRYEDNLVDTVKQYKFKPAAYQGKPVPVELNIEVNVDPY
jgi:outer membrane biosynthesis protein TonB